MYILGLESSCDETACAVVQIDPRAAELDGLPTPLVLSDVIASQVDLHNRWGGIVPEIAARRHLENILPTLNSALAEAGVTLSQIGGIAVTRGPGLVGALLVAVQVGKSIAFAQGIPFLGVNHLEGHLFSPFLRLPGQHTTPPPLPHLGVLVSGGHTALVHVADVGAYRVLGSTVDDAAGEAFDKVGKLLGMPYPAGPIIDRLAQAGDARAFRFPRAMRGPRQRQALSFSGLKTAAATLLAKQGPLLGEAMRADFCAGFQAAIVEQIVRKAALALEDAPDLRAVTLSGGVACNTGLRAGLAELATSRGLPFFVAPPRFCTDNAAMIAGVGAIRLQRGERADLALNAVAHLPLATP